MECYKNGKNESKKQTIKQLKFITLVKELTDHNMDVISTKRRQIKFKGLNPQCVFMDKLPNKNLYWFKFMSNRGRRVFEQMGKICFLPNLQKYQIEASFIMVYFCTLRSYICNKN